MQAAVAQATVVQAAVAQAQDQAGGHHRDARPDQRAGRRAAEQDPGPRRGHRSHAGEQAGPAWSHRRTLEYHMTNAAAVTATAR